MITEPTANQLLDRSSVYSRRANLILEQLIPLCVVQFILQVSSIVLMALDQKSLSNLALNTAIVLIALQLILVVLHYHLNQKTKEYLRQAGEARTRELNRDEDKS
ncbi:hypothetical protein [Paeniglutamicibacter sp. NPDC091659]|uniref:hypothetical protein n=1 Tax=Paeniglutamicibacter sp. NPDC091659 TaxID=3364389 RepID=UPI0038063561